MNLNTDNVSVESKLTKKEAIAKIKASRNRVIFLHVANVFAAVGEESKGYNLSTCLKVSAPAAIEFLNKTISPIMEDKVWVSFQIDNYCMFIR